MMGKSSSVVSDGETVSPRQVFTRGAAIAEQLDIPASSRRAVEARRECSRERVATPAVAGNPYRNYVVNCGSDRSSCKASNASACGSI
jgi:hypothetical protein